MQEHSWGLYLIFHNKRLVLLYVHYNSWQYQDFRCSVRCLNCMRPIQLLGFSRKSVTKKSFIFALSFFIVTYKFLCDGCWQKFERIHDDQSAVLFGVERNFVYV